MIERGFESPQGLVLVVIGGVTLCVVLAARAWSHERRLRAWLGRGAGPAGVLPDLALVAAFAAIGIALCGPLLDERAFPVDEDGIDLVLLFDASRSMDARDTPPSRMQRAKEAASGLLRALPPGDRVGLVAFAGTGLRLAPLTPDRDVLVALLDGLDSRSATPHASDLTAGLSSALELFEPDADRRRAIVLLSDGELSDAGAGGLDRIASGRHVRIFAALFGGDVGATIPDHGVPLVASDGSVALTRRQTQRVGALAEATGGAVVLADRWGRIDVDELARSLRGAHPGSNAPTAFEIRPAVATWPFALTAFLLLLAEPSLRTRWAAPRDHRVRTPARAAAAHGARRRRSIAASAALLFALVGLGAAAPELELRDESAAWLRAGADAIDAGDDEAALHAFRTAAAVALQPDAAGTAWYQIGVWHLKHDDPLPARDAFLESLRLDPHRRDAVFNLEWSELALEARRSRERDSQPPLDPRSPEEDEPDTARDETARDPDAARADAEPEHGQGHADEPRPSAFVRPRGDGIEAPGANPDAGASGRPLPDAEALSWWLDLVEDEPGRAQRPDSALGRGPARRGPPW